MQLADLPMSLFLGLAYSALVVRVAWLVRLCNCGLWKGCVLPLLIASGCSPGLNRARLPGWSVRMWREGPRKAGNRQAARQRQDFANVGRMLHPC